MRTATLSLIWAVALGASACRSQGQEADTPRAPPGEAWLTPQQVEEAKIKLAGLEAFYLLSRHKLLEINIDVG